MQDLALIIATIMTFILGLLMPTIPERPWRIGVLAGMFLVQFIVISYLAKWMISLTLLILGWMACAVLGTGRSNQISDTENLSRSELIFRVFTYLFFVAAAFFLAQKSTSVFTDLTFFPAFLGIGMMIMGLLTTGFVRPYYNVIFGLLMVIAGFEIVYYSLELSMLVVGLFGAVKMGLAFFGSYWYIHYQEDATE